MMALVHHVFPLADHPEKAVVQDEDLERDPVGDQGAELLDVHLKTAVAVDQDERVDRVGEPGADGRGQTEAHGPEPARADPLARPAEAIILRRPHLMLADTRDQGRVARGQLGDDLHDGLWLDVFGPAVGLGHLLAPLRDLGQPVVMVGGLTGAQGVFEEVPELRDQVQIGRDGLVDLRGVDVDMGDALARGKTLHSDPVVEPPAEREDQVCIAQGIVGRDGAVHARHAEIVRQLEGQGTERVEGGGDRHGEAFGEGPQSRCRVGMDDPAAGLHDRALGGGQCGEDGVGLDRVEGDRLAMTDPGRVLPARISARLGQLHVLADVDHDRAGTSAGRQRIGLAQHPLQIAHVFDQIVVLGDRPR